MPKMFTDKVVPISRKQPFFFKPIQDGMDKPKTELAFRVPASKITKKTCTLRRLKTQWRVWILLLIGRTQTTTLMMVKTIKTSSRREWKVAKTQQYTE